VASLLAINEDAKVASKHLEKVARYFRKHPVVVEGDDWAREHLSALRNAIEYAQIDAELFLRRQSRKTDKGACISAGVGWLKESIRRTTGEANLEVVANLAVAVLDVDTIDRDTVKHALTPSERLYTIRARSHRKILQTRPLIRGADA
jgi:hypothetical protein